MLTTIAEGPLVVFASSSESPDDRICLHIHVHVQPPTRLRTSQHDYRENNFWFYDPVPAGPYVHLCSQWDISV